MVASFVPAAPDSPTLNAAIAMEPYIERRVLNALRKRYDQIGIRRWGVWTDGAKHDVVARLKDAGMRITSSSPGMGATLGRPEPQRPRARRPADLATVGRVNDLAYGNPDGRLERTLAPLPDGLLLAYKAEHEGRPASVALALHHGEDCGISFVATAPYARRQGLAADVMARVALDAQEAGLTISVAAGHRAGREALPRARLPPGVGHAAVGAQAVTLNPALQDVRFCPRCAAEADVTYPRSIVCSNCGYAAFFNPKPVACSIPRDPDGNIILMRRGTEPSRGRWTMPGGFVDLGESVPEAARREAKEELEIDVTIEELVGVYSSAEDRVVVVVYAATTTQQPSTTEEALEVNAFSRTEIPWSDLAFWSDERALRDHLAAARPAPR